MMYNKIYNIKLNNFKFFKAFLGILITDLI